MSRYNHHIYKVYIADGFATDCDELIHRCLQLSKLDYQEFCKIWKDLDFSMIFHGRSTGAEIAELSEELVYISKQYLLKNTENFEESVAGLFLLYGVLTLQPYPNFAWLRLTPDDIPAIKRIELVARQDKRLDLLYILGEILIKYTQYHAVERERGMESVLRKYLDGYTSIDKLGVRPKGVFYRQNEELDIIRDLGTVTRQYTKAKDMLKVGGRPDPSLQYINDNLPFELNVTLKKIINGAIDDDNGDDSPDEHYNMVQAIKTRALTNTVDSMRHLTAVEDRPSTITNSSPRTNKHGKSDLKTPTGKVKSGSPTKRMTSSPRKRKLDEKLVTKDKICMENTHIDTENADIDLEEFQKGAAKVIAEGTDDGITHTKETDIQIDPTAVVLDDDVGRNMEIEFIDVGNQGYDNDDNEPGRSTDSTNEINRTTLKTKIKKPEKRELKRLHLKSKFRRLGMLPVANFNDKNNDDGNIDRMGNESKI